MCAFFIASHSRLLLFVLCFWPWIQFCVCVNFTVLQPLIGSRRPSGQEVAMVVFPGYGIKAEEYRDYCTLVQSLYPEHLWVVLVDGVANYASTVSALVLGAVSALKGAGVRGEAAVLLAAHGEAGKTVSQFVREDPSIIRALILLGAVLPRIDDRPEMASEGRGDFPIPVLSMVGELDGVTRITRLAEAVTEKMNSQRDSLKDMLKMPLVVLNGANHGLFTKSTLPDLIFEKDIETEGSQHLARQDAAWKTALFVAHVVGAPRDFMYMAQAEFQHAHQHVVRVTEPIRKLQLMTRKEVQSYWVKAAQKWLSGLTGPVSMRLSADSYIVTRGSGYQGSPPTLRHHAGVHYVITFSHVIKKLGPRFSPLSSDEIAARMLGPVMLQRRLRARGGQNYSCADLNYAAYVTAYHSASDRSRRRYDRMSRGMTFEPDVLASSPSSWENTTLKTEVKDGVMHVTSSSFVTSPSNYENPGVYYCRLLPPDKALEWILVDSLRREVDIKHKEHGYS